MANRTLKHRRGAVNLGCMLVIVVVVLLAGGLYLTRERWLPWFNESFGGKSSSAKSDQFGDPDMSVYVEPEGLVYHRAGCSLLTKDVREMTLEQARASLYKPCTKCNPPQ
jgi:hypothetical protein